MPYSRLQEEYEFGDFRVRPEILRDINNYVMRGDRPGHFVTAVLSGKLYEACAQADSDAGAQLKGIVSYIVNAIPTGAYGSEEKFMRWVALRSRGIDPIKVPMTQLT